MLVALAVALPGAALGSPAGPRKQSPAAATTAKKKKRHARCKRYHRVRLRRHGHFVKRHGRFVKVRRCVKTKKRVATPAPPAPAAPKGPGFIVGSVSGPAPLWEATKMPSMHPRLVRFEASINTPAAKLLPYVLGLAARGTEVIPMASFYGRIPSTSEAQSLGSWAHTFGPGAAVWRGNPNAYLAPRYIEFGNETNESYQFGGVSQGSSYIARAQSYALRAEDAMNALAGTGMSLLLQGDNGGCGCSEWVDGMFSAVPDLASRVGGWTVHPYGPPSRYRPIMDEMVRDLAKHGDSRLPIYATEYGISTDNGRCLSDNYDWPKCLTYQQAAADLQSSIEDMHRTYPTLAAIMVFNQRDQAPSGSNGDRESYFGIFQNGGGRKGAYTDMVQQLQAKYHG